MIPTNQTYRRAKTLADHPALCAIKREFEEWIDNDTDFGNHGRSYDAAVAMFSVDMRAKVVCELGARGSALASYLTGIAAEVWASDLFEGFDGMGDISSWRRKLIKNAVNSERLSIEQKDMRATEYEDDFFDVVLSFSTIEHIHGRGDIEAAREMGRICKPGGFIVIGTEMSSAYMMQSTRFYDELALWQRVIEPTGCGMHGPNILRVEGADLHSHRNGLFPFTSCIFVLRKPAEENSK